MANAATVEEYLDGFPAEIRERLQQVRTVILAEVGRELGEPPAERTSYGMAAVMLDERAAIYYAGWKHHIGVYPVPGLPEELEAEVSPLRAAKDTVQLVHSRPLPLDLVARITGEVVRRYRAGRLSSGGQADRTGEALPHAQPGRGPRRQVGDREPQGTGYGSEHL